MKKMKSDIPEYAKKQIEILHILRQGSLQQHQLRDELGISGPTLLYHLDRMEKEHLIVKKLLFQIGNAKNNEISLNPAAMQKIREILGLKIENYTLITGFGIDKEAINLPDNSLRLLRKAHYKINRIVCITTPEAKKNRDLTKKEKNLIDADRYIEFVYNEFRYLDSEFFMNVESILSEEMQQSNVILDLTPLSKLLSFKLLELANKYNLPCFYIGRNEKDEEFLYWFTNMRIEGAVSK